MGVNPCQKALGGRFFISCSAINLAGKEESFNQFRLKSILKKRRVEVVIFNSIRRPENLGIFQTFDCMKCIQLNLKRKG